MSSISMQIDRSEFLNINPSDLTEAETNINYIIKDVVSNDSELNNFLFTLGCYKGESITVISKLAENYVISVKDARYSIDEELAKAVKL